jgi:hypothetical protein
MSNETEQTEQTEQDDIGAVQSDAVQSCTIPAREFSAVLAATDLFRAPKKDFRPVLQSWQLDLDPIAQTLTVQTSDSYAAVIATVQFDRENFPSVELAPVSFMFGQTAKLSDIVKVCAGPVGITKTVAVEVDKIAQTARITGAESSVTIGAMRGAEFPNLRGLWPEQDRRGVTAPFSVNPVYLSKIEKSMTAAHKCAKESMTGKAVALVCCDPLKPALFAYDIAEIALSVEILVMPVRVN